MNRIFCGLLLAAFSCSLGNAQGNNGQANNPQSSNFQTQVNNSQFESSQNGTVNEATYQTTTNAQYAEPSELFKTKYNEYVARAKALSPKHMTPEQVDELADKAMSLIDDIKNQMFSVIGGNNFVLRYSDGKAFPNMSNHMNNSDPDQRVVKFTIACNAIYNVMSRDFVKKIVAKSPLEMVSLIREMLVFSKFVSANPNDFGHGIFRERRNPEVAETDEITIYATNDAILRIMKDLVYKYLLNETNVYKLSRTLTLFANKSGQVSPEELNSFIDSLKRNTGDDSRLSIYIPNTMFTLSPSDENLTKLQVVERNYVNELNLGQVENAIAEKQLHQNTAKELAKQLLGLNPNVNLVTSDKVLKFCKACKTKISELSKLVNSNDKKKALKAKRDVGNLKEIMSFLKTTSRLFDSMYKEPEILDLILVKIPEFVPNIGSEIGILLRFTVLVSKPDYNFDEVIQRLRNFAKQSDEGNYLLSPLISVGMKYSNKNIDFKKILNEQDFSQRDVCRYLRIK